MKTQPRIHCRGASAVVFLVATIILQVMLKLVLLRGSQTRSRYNQYCCTVVSFFTTRCAPREKMLDGGMRQHNTSAHGNPTEFG